jgi:hypothetical protein
MKKKTIVHKQQSRRAFLTQSALAATGAMLASSTMLAAMGKSFTTAKNAKSRNILLRSGWQVENIGDIAHTPAMLALMKNIFLTQKLLFGPGTATCPTTRWIC